MASKEQPKGCRRMMQKVSNVKTYSQVLKTTKPCFLSFGLVSKLHTLYIKDANFRRIQFDFLNRLKLLRFMASTMCVRVMSISDVSRKWIMLEGKSRVHDLPYS